MRFALLLLPLLAAAGCDADEASSPESPGPASAIFVDSDGDTTRFAESPRRIVALIPAINEILIELGVEDRLVGRTRYDSAPEVEDLPSVGEGLGPDLEALVALEPDLVIRYGGPTDTETPARLDRLGIPNIAVRTDRISDIRRLYPTLGDLVGAAEPAAARVAALDATLDSVAEAVVGLPPVGVSYLLGADPPWAAGPESYIGELIALAGGELRPETLPPLYTQISPESLVAADLDLILLSGGDPLDPRLAQGRRVERVPEWVEVPGPDIRRAAWVIAELLHPGLARGTR